MSYQIDVQNEPGYPVNEQRLQSAAETVLSLHSAAQGSTITIVITDNAIAAELNLKYRGVGSPTDVLSFPAEPPPIEMPGEAPYLGDLVIAYPYALAQAQREDHDPHDSLVLLVIHGTLHLLGFDHDTPGNRAEMWGAQESALRTLGIPTEIVPSLEVGYNGDDA